jgi:hypothetical protein
MTFKDARDSRLSQVANLCNTSDGFKALLNEAIPRLMIRGDWPGVVVPIAVCLDSSCVTWPRYVGNIRKAKIGNRIVNVRNSWYQFLDGPGSCGCFTQNEPGLTLLSTGHAATYRDIRGENKKVRFYIDCLQDAGKQIILRGFIDSNGQPLKELVDGEWVYQKTLTLANQFVSTPEDIRTFGRVHLPDDMQCRVRAFSYDTVNDTLLDLAIYDPGETDPWYPRSQIQGGCVGCHNNCDGLTSFLAEVKLQFIPIKRDTDLVLISNIGALKNAFMAIRYEEEGKDREAVTKWGMAVKELNLQMADENPDWTIPFNYQPLAGQAYSNQMV